MVAGKWRSVARPSLDVALAAAIGLLCVATRWLHRGHTLFSWDSGLLAAGIRSFDFAAGHPHPPFYPLVVAAGKVLAPFLGPVDALVFLSVFGSGVLAAFTYLVARGLVGRVAALGAGFLVILSPVALFNGAVALSYALEGATSAVVAWAAWRCRGAPTPGNAVVLAVSTSIAIGVRPSALFLLFPLALWGVWGRWRALGWALGSGAAASLAWGVPTLLAGGGLAAFLAGNRYQSRHVVFADTVFSDGWGVVVENGRRLASYVPDEFPFLRLLFVLGLVSAPVWWKRRSPGASFLAAWAAPSVLFYLFVYAGWPVFPSGYVLVLVPAISVAVAWLGQSLVQGISALAAPALVRQGAVAVVAVLLVIPVTWAEAWDDVTAGQREADEWSAAWWALERDYPPEETALLTYYGWFWARIEHPQYLTWGVLPYWNETGDVLVHVIEGQGHRNDQPSYADALDGDPDHPPHAIPPWVKQVIVVHAPPSRGETWLFKPGQAATNVTLESGLRVVLLDPSHLDFIEQSLAWYDEAGRLMG